MNRSGHGVQEFFLYRTERPISLGRNDRVAEPDYASDTHLSNESGAVKELFLEVVAPSGELAWSCAWVTILNSAETGSADLEFSADVPHEFDSADDEIAPTLRKHKVRITEEPVIDEGDLALAGLALVPASFSAEVSISSEAASRDRCHLLDFLHRLSGNRTDEDSSQTRSLAHRVPFVEGALFWLHFTYFLVKYKT